MVKVILGSALGGLVAGGIALFAAGQARGGMTPTAPASFATPVSAMTQPAAPVLACGPNQEPTMARVLVNGAEAATLTCVDRVLQGDVTYPQPGMVRRVSYRDRSDDIVRYESDVRPHRRSIAKTAMIIGGSAGTGAGVGAILGGKKGALIGAALGGGTASIWEASKR